MPTDAVPGWHRSCERRQLRGVQGVPEPLQTGSSTSGAQLAVDEVQETDAGDMSAVPVAPAENIQPIQGVVPPSSNRRVSSGVLATSKTRSPTKAGPDKFRNKYGIDTHAARMKRVYDRAQVDVSNLSILFCTLFFLSALILGYD